MNLTIKFQKAAVLLTRFLSLKLADIIASSIGKLYYFLLKDKRNHILTNLSYIFFSEKTPNRFYNYYIKKTFKNFARCMVDFYRLGFITKKELIESVEPVGIENCRAALKLNMGCVLITLHLGNWDYAGAYLAAIGYPMSALVEETTEPEIYNLYTKHRERTGMKTYPIAKSAYAFLDTIKNNRILAIVADRDIAENGITVNFFSGKRNIPKNLGPIIVKKRLPVVFGYMVLNPPNKKQRYLGFIEPLCFFDDVEEFNHYLVKKFEEYIRLFPDQWFVFHPEWIE